MPLSLIALINRLEKSWYSDRPIALLRPLGGLYALVMRLRQYLYGRGVLRPVRAARPVICLGNLTVGGAGKTPACLALAKSLLARGKRPAIVSRGYGRGKNAPSPLVVAKGWAHGDMPVAQSPADSGDEPWLMAQALPPAAVLVDAKRSRAARVAADELGADVLLLDDGYQHLALYADARILLIPARQPFGNGRVLPAGPLREPLEGHGRADIIVVTGCEAIPPDILTLCGARPAFAAEYASTAWRSASDGRRLPPDHLAGHTVYAFCGLGRPDGFRRSLKKLRVEIRAFEALRDHQVYDEKLLSQLAENFKSSGAEYLVTTAKDAVKIPQNFFSEFLILEMEMRIHKPDEFIETVLNIVSKGRA